MDEDIPALKQLTVREALELLPRHIESARGGIRISATFRKGLLDGAPRVTVFRVAPHAIHAVQRGGINAALLEHIAAEMNIADGTVIVEYQDNRGNLELHWIDVAWDDHSPRYYDGDDPRLR